MLILSLLPLTLCLATVLAQNNFNTMETCESVMNNNGFNFSTFRHGVAHGIHSISLEEIRHFFEPDAPANNKIPVVNANLSAEQIILFDSPLAGYDTDFKTLSLQVMSYFMLNDAPNFYMQGTNTLEKITHQYHMHEIYAAAVPIYRGMKENPPMDPSLCPCVNDILGNGIFSEMVNVARHLKFFAYDALVFIYASNDKTPRYSSPLTHNEVSSEMVDQYKKEYLKESTHETADKVLTVDPWKPNTLAGPKGWISYEAMLTYSMMEQEELKDFATFIYCKLNQPV